MSFIGPPYTIHIMMMEGRTNTCIMVERRVGCIFLLTRGIQMPYEVAPLPFKPHRLEGLSNRLLVSHYENNYGGASAG
jgi:hypothetical protein